MPSSVFRADMLNVRRDLREVKRALRADIDHLNNWLQFFNIAFVPLLIGAGGIAYAVMQRRRATRGLQAVDGRHAMKPQTFSALLIAAIVTSAFAIVSYANNNRVARPKVAGAPLVSGWLRTRRASPASRSARATRRLRSPTP